MLLTHCVPNKMNYGTELVDILILFFFLAKGACCVAAGGTKSWWKSIENGRGKKLSLINKQAKQVSQKDVINWICCSMVLYGSTTYSTNTVRQNLTLFELSKWNAKAEKRNENGSVQSQVRYVHTLSGGN